MCWLPASREKLKGWRACMEQICVCYNLAPSSRFSLMGLCNIQRHYIPKHFMDCYNAGIMCKPVQ